MGKIVGFLTDSCGRRLKTGAVALLLASAAQGGGDEHEALDNIRARAESHALELVSGRNLSNLRAEAINIDPRLRLDRCGGALEAFSSGNVTVGRVTVGVRCEGPKPWTLYVPVEIEATAHAVSAGRALSRGDILKESDLRLSPLPVDALPHGWFSAAADLVGMEIRRPLQNGAVLTRTMVEQPQIVRRGQEVNILARSGPVEVRMKGVALGNGASGELIGVRNKNSGRTVQARILDAGTVEVRM